MGTDVMWKMDELVTLSQRLIDLLPEGDSKRIRWLPNERLVRYYTTLGLLDRPAAIKGRTAFYNLRHLLQVLAIKTLQAEGLSLQECQQRLAGRSDQELVDTIGLPADFKGRLDGATEVETTPPPRRFWERAPAEPSVPVRPKETFALQGLELAPGVQLVIDSRLYPNLDPARLRRAASDLVELLAQAQHSTEDTL